MTFGEKLVLFRTRKNISQKALAETLDITPTRLNYWEKGKREPDIAMIGKLATALDVSANVLIGLEDNEETKKSPAPESTEDEEVVQNMVQRLTALLVDVGWIEPDGDLTDAQLRTLASYVLGLRFYFQSDL